jgi:hypothetical protein
MADTLEEVKKVAQRALDIHEIQNVMSKHEYYHAVGKHKEEIDDLWAHKTPGASFEAGDVGMTEGIEEVERIYVEGNKLRGKQQLEEIRKLFPQIEDKEENEFIGNTVMHTLTTPVIEVAGDGKTAKGVWVSPGHLTAMRGGKLQAFWFWERYGADFVKEDGQWKIWHLRVYTDFLTPYEKSWVENSLEPAPPHVEPEGFPKPNRPPTSPAYQEYSPTTRLQFEPRLPEPYRTFSETFSYGPPETA